VTSVSVTSVFRSTAFIVVSGLMLIEARRATRNERAQRRRGGIEASGDVYQAMRLAYPAAFLAMFAEGAMRGRPGTGALIAGATLFGCAKVLKWWAIATLGPFWTFRVIVLPGVPLVASGPYRWMRHPNYVGVIGELIGTALITGAVVSGPVVTAIFMALLSKRIDVESRMLHAARSPAATSKQDGPPLTRRT
jgi:methyltransferase